MIVTGTNDRADFKVQVRITNFMVTSETSRIKKLDQLFLLGQRNWGGSIDNSKKYSQQP